MGVKAVFGALNSHLLCFGGRGDPAQSSYYSVARSAANRAVERPFVLAVGGGAHVRDNLGGKVLNLARVSSVFGATSQLCGDPGEVRRLAQWPVAVVLHDVWRIVGFPHLVADLGMPDRTILAAAMDGIVRPAGKIEELWRALADWDIEPCSLPLPANFYDSGKPGLVVGRLPLLRGGSSSEEGRRLFKLQSEIERNSAVSREAKRLNCIANGGKVTCEACRFSHTDGGMFDAHHPVPLSAGIRTTLAEHLIVLCPTCHRRAHRKEDKLLPYTLLELQDWVERGRP